MTELPNSWAHLRTELEAGRPAILAIGSYEAHGPHLPNDTDTVIAAATCREIARRVGGFALPVLPYGATSRPRSGGGDVFPLPALRIPTLFAVVTELVTGVVRAGARQLVMLTGHYENASVLWDATFEATADTDCRAVVFDAPWELIDADVLTTTFPEGVNWAADHGGLLETAIMRHLAPDRVGEPPAPWSLTPRNYDVLPTPGDAVPATGIVNDARQVTAADGAVLFESMLDGLESALRREQFHS
ncbi:creatininase family protein [Mycolicibacterium goodii]|uniref:creatininase family protein n=1 Tax=Mycolicibacterium TaxID=1866885 RepID=UPI0013036BD3|nr:MULTISPECIES: creatininase family protein [Mycolicibacterium]ULN48257.1 creatininase family protein [Mycolicibacterium goodii]